MDTQRTENYENEDFEPEEESKEFGFSRIISFRTSRYRTDNRILSVFVKSNLKGSKGRKSCTESKYNTDD